MNLSTLIGQVLADRGNAVMVIANASDGEDAAIRSVNAPFEGIIGKPAKKLIGSPLGTLRSLADDPADWNTFISAVQDLAPLHLDMRLRVNNREVWLGFGLDFKTSDDGSFGILIGRDITDSRRRSMLEGETQRMLASVFQHLGVAATIVRANGDIFMANLAFRVMFGYSGNDVVGLNVATLTPPEHAEAARAARARQLLDGGSYDMRLEAIRNGGGRLPVLLHSELLKTAKGEQLRVVTLVADVARRPSTSTNDMGLPVIPQTVRRGVGQMMAVSLAALRESYGKTWPQIASRAMMLAEQIVKRRLGSADVFGRSDDEGFVIWFDSSDEIHNEKLLERITREVRLRFLNELGADVAAQLCSAMVKITVKPDDAASLSASPVPSTALLQGLQEERLRVIAGMKLLLKDLHDAPAADIRTVNDRDGNSIAIVIVDFFQTARHRVAELTSSFPNLAEQSAEFDLLRLEMASSQLTNRRRSGKVLVPISWASLTVATCRRRFDEWLVRLETHGRSRLILVISGISPLANGTAWRDVVEPLQRQCSGIGLMLVGVEGDHERRGQEAMVSGWKFSILVIDCPKAESVMPIDYIELVSIARRRQVPILIRSAVADDLQEWSSLGAEMFTSA